MLDFFRYFLLSCHGNLILTRWVSINGKVVDVTAEATTRRLNRWKIQPGWDLPRVPGRGDGPGESAGAAGKHLGAGPAFCRGRIGAVSNRIVVFGVGVNPERAPALKHVSKSTAAHWIAAGSHRMVGRKAIQELSAEERRQLRLQALRFVPVKMPPEELPGLRFVLPICETRPADCYLRQSGHTPRTLPRAAVVAL